MTDQPTPLPPEVVSAILRDPNSPLYPSAITVYCDECGTTVKRDYMVSDDMTKAERLDVARAHLRREGWICDEKGDYCAMCSRPALAAVLAEIAVERARQDAKWGEQNHRDGTGPDQDVLDGWTAAALAEAARNACQRNAEMGIVSWRDILAEEVAEAFAESDPVRLRAELLQVAAVAVAWAEAIDRRPGGA